MSTADVDTSYATSIVPQMVLMGLGIGFVSTPATESIMLVLPPARAGVGSAVNDATRELGGTLGVAVVGSLFSSVYAAAARRRRVRRRPGRRCSSGRRTPWRRPSRRRGSDPALLTAAQDAFISGLSAGCLLVGGLCLAGALVAAVTLPGRRFVPPAAVLAADGATAPVAA